MASPNTLKKALLNWFDKNQRDLPWRHTYEPYQIWISEIMLQQTQAGRVIEKFKEFIAAFPDITALGGADLKAILKVWQGLGYNRRALYLKKLAQTVITDYGGVIPDNRKELEELPGLGPATSASIAAFAFNRPVVFLETNIRTVFIHHFFPGEEKVRDSAILPLAEAAIDQDNPRRWYNALMDYGTMLKKSGVNPGRRSVHYCRQSPFKGSDRQIRGMSLRLLTEHASLTRNELIDRLDGDSPRITKILDRLVKEGLIREEKKCYRIF